MHFQIHIDCCRHKIEQYEGSVDKLMYVHMPPTREILVLDVVICTDRLCYDDDDDDGDIDTQKLMKITILILIML